MLQLQNKQRLNIGILGILNIKEKQTFDLLAQEDSRRANMGLIPAKVRNLPTSNIHQIRMK